MDDFLTASSSASVSATSPVVLESSSEQAPNAANTSASTTPSLDRSNEYEGATPDVKRCKKLTSEVWDHFTKYEITKTEADGNKVVEKWSSCNSKGCTYKGPRSNARGNRGTSVFNTHLQNKHKIMVGQQKLVLNKVEGNESMAAPATFKYDEAISMKKFFLAIIMHEYPFNIVDHEYLVDFIRSLRPTFPIRSRPTVKKDIINIFLEEKRKVYEYFKTVQCRFSATMDMWTSGQTKGYMCITVHWIDENWCMQKRIIKFMHVQGNHSGKNIGLYFYDCIVDWNLDRKLLSLSLDNASANDKCVEGLISKFIKNNLICDGMFFHVRCFNHILNLVSQDGLKTIVAAIANIRNTVSIVRTSPQQKEEFKKCESECDLNPNAELILDVPTRWNSTYDMLKKALYFRDAFDRLFLRHKKKYKKCAPTSNNWNMASKICDCLKIFKDATVLFSGSTYPTTNNFFITFCKFKIAIDEWCGSSNKVIKTMARSMKLKYDKYWEKSNMALSVAVFFDPRYKRSVVEYYAPIIYPTTHTQEIEKFSNVITQLFEAYVSTSKKTTSTSSDTNVCQMPPEDLDLDDGLDSFLSSRSQKSDRVLKTELEVYMEQELQSRKDANFDILSWWKVNQVEFPVLSWLARDILSIQVSTVASDSAFSAGGRVVDPFRGRLDLETVQALICNKNWIGSAKGGDIASVVKDMDMPSLEQRFATLVHMLEEPQEGDSEDDLEDLMDDGMDD